ncbi:molybdopterin-dependent oxidoreductase [Ornithinimicrobium cryptoxanthini]|uniref:Molybdopterin-dependent oxidoreductase n=1 Tax=Ornithinimicrobium cryptoxanthini TaxID=2934161 RepID=A0ABY4YFK1_9MICO|nr:molybdopterin-dependent oxidoreductase [Ornithinimicrobium cryptoxanthini]USQ75551.1 molybdopterin-dependent oxidoreductase [Ornithinimicrobium cryptoxanthini]
MSTRMGGAVAGIAAGTLTLAVAEIGAALMMRGGMGSGNASPLVAVAGAFIDRTPAWLKDFAIATFGTQDKLALFVGMAIVLSAVCAAIGALGGPAKPPQKGVGDQQNLPKNGWPTWGLGLFALVGLVGVAAVLSRPDAAVIDVAPTVIGTLVGLWTLDRLWGRLRVAEAAVDHDQTMGSGQASRRSVLLWGGGLTVVGALGIVAGRTLSRAGEVVEAARAKFGTLRVSDPVQVPAGASQGVAGQTPYVTPNDEFYRIDTAVTVPQVDPQTWRLRVTGMVDRELELTFQDLLDADLVEALVTLTCVSNYVGGNLAGNGVWTGLPVREVLARAGLQDGADMVLSTSVDGFTAGTPLEAMTDDRNALIAVAQNGEPLLPEHGFPVRLVVPGLYGYVSATKWVTELKVTRFDQDEGYWTPRGWSALGPIKTASRIDVPRGESVNAGEVVIAGVAWAQHRGIDKVEVRIGDGDWQEAQLAAEPTIDSWRQWMLTWQAEPGEYAVSVRATDGTGEVQTDELANPAPDGASGWHTVDVTVEGS